jgi:hypothetical protein
MFFPAHDSPISDAWDVLFLVPVPQLAVLLPVVVGGEAAAAVAGHASAAGAEEADQR